MDAASEAFLEQLVDAIAGSRSLLIVNFRPEYHATWSAKSYYRQIPLAPLGPEAVRAILEDLLGHDPSIDGLAQSIYARTGGNPFFTEEVIQSLIESGALQGIRGSYQLVKPIERLQVPTTVQALLAARIDRLGEREKFALQSAAVIGKDFSEPILRRVVNEISHSPLSETELGLALRLLKDGDFILEEAARLVMFALAADDKSGGAAMAAIQNPPQLMIFFYECIGFIDQQGRPYGFYDPVDHCWREVGRGQGTVGKLGQQRQQSGLAATFLR